MGIRRAASENTRRTARPANGGRPRFPPTRFPNQEAPPMNTAEQAAPGPSGIAEHKIKVLLIDDQAIIGEAVRRMLAGEADVEFLYCQDPADAVRTANEYGPTVILQDLVMPQIDGLTLVKFIRANPATREVPLIVLSSKEEALVKADAFALGASDYIVKLPDRIELIARIRHHSRGYINLLQRNEAFQALQASQKALAEELNSAAEYVISLLPKPLAGDMDIGWKYRPCSQLGGDSFGYHWLDHDHFAIYLLDVCGHGVGAALLSVSAINVLRGGALPGVDFSQPEAVLKGLNETFQGEDHNGMFFTIWYGVYQKSTRRLLYSSGGHPPAILVSGDTPDTARRELFTRGMIIGGMPGMAYNRGETSVLPGDRLYVFCDGVFEIRLQNGKMWEMSAFFDLLGQCSRPGGGAVENLYDRIRQINGGDNFDDDFSLMEICFK
jgi:sigma-B regulation protein RsbU (phosphoserine phosphatase)